MRYKKVLFLLLIILILNACGFNREKEKDRYFNQGKKYLEQGEYTKAEKSFRRALEVEPKFAAAYYGLGVALFKEKRYSEAYGALQRALELNPDFLSAHVLLGQILLLANKPEKALKEAETVLSQKSDSVEAELLKAAALLRLKKYTQAEGLLSPLCKERHFSACLILADLYLKNNRVSEAENILRRTWESHPGDPRVGLLLARILEREKKYDEAGKIYQSLYETHSNNFKYVTFLVRFYEKRKNFEKAEGILKKAIKDKIGGEEPYLLLAQLYALTGKTSKIETILEEGRKQFPQSFSLLRELILYYFEHSHKEEAYGLLDNYISQTNQKVYETEGRLLKALLLRKEERLKEALHEVDQVLRESPRLVSAHILKGDILFQLKDYTGAIGEYRAALGEEPRNIEIMFRLARAHLLNSETDLAIDLYRRILALDPRNKRAHWELAEALIKKGKIDQAQEILEKELSTNPGDLIALEKLVDIYLQEGHKSQARKILEKTLALRPKHPLVLAALVRIVQKAHLTTEMIDYCEKLKAQNPHPFYSLLLADLYGKNGNYKRAIKLYQEVLSKEPENVVALNNLAFYLAQYEPTPENLQWAERKLYPLIKKYPDRPEIIDTLAWVQYRKGNYTGALRLLKDLEEKGNLSPVISYHLGCIYYRLGREKEALIYLYKALSQKEQFVGRKEAQHLFKKLKNKIKEVQK